MEPESAIPSPGARSLYDLDFFQWTARNAELLRAGNLEQADLLHIAEELEDMGKRERRALVNPTEVLLRHLLKWEYQPEHRSGSWQSTINVHRQRIRRRLRDSPSLRRYLDEELHAIYCDASSNAAAETGLPKAAFPAQCPFTLDQILSAD